MNDEDFYDTVANELKRGDLKQGLWTKALAESNGDNNLARSRYLSLRARQLQDAARKAALNRAGKAVPRAIWRFVLLAIGILTGISAVLAILLMPLLFFDGTTNIGSELGKLLLCAAFDGGIAFLCFRALRKRTAQVQELILPPNDRNA